MNQRRLSAALFAVLATGSVIAKAYESQYEPAYAYEHEWDSAGTATGYLVEPHGPHVSTPLPTSFAHDPQCSLWEGLTLFAGVDGSKQPQDYGVNANLGLRISANWSAPLWEELGIGYQVGTAVDPSDNAVRVFELLGEDTTRFQNHTTVGIFQRFERFGWGLAYDHLYQDGFDTVTLGQWRGRLQYRLSDMTDVGLTVQLRSFGDTATFLGNQVSLRTIDQFSVFCRQQFETGVQGTIWVGVADGHGESNGVTGPAPRFDESLVVGADILCPLNDSFAIYGETNLIFPADTGTVDAFLGIAWYPGCNAKRARRQLFSAMLPLASDTTFAIDLAP